MRMARVREARDLLELYRTLVTQIGWEANLCHRYNGKR